MVLNHHWSYRSVFEVYILSSCIVIIISVTIIITLIPVSFLLLISLSYGGYGNDYEYGGASGVAAEKFYIQLSFHCTTIIQLRHFGSVLHSQCSISYQNSIK